MASSMRTIEQMISQVRRLVRDTDTSNPVWSDSQIRTFLQRASGWVFDMMLSDPLTQFWLRKNSAPLPLSDNVESYPLPADCGFVECVQARADFDGMNATLTGGTGAQATFGTWAAVSDASFRIWVDGRVVDVRGIDFSGDTSMTEVAATLQAALRAAGGGMETVAWSTDHFVITSYDDIRPVESVPVPTGYTQTDISTAAWMDCGSGATVAITATNGNWLNLDRMENPPSGVMARSSVQALYPPVQGLAGMPTYFAQNATQSHVTIGPKQASADALYRFTYYRLPTFPTSDSDYFYNLPDRIDDLIETLAAAEASMEELQNGVPAGKFGEMFQNRYAALRTARGDRMRPRTRSIPVDTRGQQEG